MISDRPRILYVQYTNPAAYPPLEHSARLLADNGCEVLLLGINLGPGSLRMARHDRIHVELLPCVRPGWRQKVHYLRFSAWATRHARRWRPHWIYASDPLSCPVALSLTAATNARLVYHEHDAPAEGSGSSSWFMRTVLSARRQLAGRADICVVPNERRADAFQRAYPSVRVLTVWNCPMQREINPVPRVAQSTLRVLYHGSIVPARLPLSVIDAIARLPETVTLVLVGYETAGHVGYVDQLKRRADERRVADRVQFVGAMSRTDLMRYAATCDVGLALLPLNSSDANEQAMVGASNKVFDYLAAGLAVVVPDSHEWRTAFVDPGLAVACDPESADSVASALHWLVMHPRERLAMGERGQQQIADEWNYERMFAPVLARLAPATVERAEPVPT